MNVNSRGHNLDTRFDLLFSEIKHPPGLRNPVGATPLLSKKLVLALALHVIYSAPNAPFK
jgi:hypothetical protein